MPRSGAKTVLLVPQCAGVSDPFHFYLGYFLPMIGDSRLKRISRNSRRVLYQQPRLPSLQQWIDLSLSLRGITAQPLEGDALQEYLRRGRWTSRVLRRDINLVFRDSDNVHKLGSLSFRRLLKAAQKRLSQSGLMESQEFHSNHQGKRACIVVRANPDPLKPVAFPRHVPNMDEIGKFLQSKGWEVVFLDPAIETPQTVLKVVSGSSLLVGQYGAGIAHCMWLPKGSSVIEISSGEENPMPSWVYRRLAESASLNFVQSRCQQSWTSPASLEIFGAAYLSLGDRTLRLQDQVKSFLTAYSHIFLGRLLISAGWRKE